MPLEAYNKYKMDINKFIADFEEVFEVENGTMKAIDVFRDYDEWDSITLLTLTAMLDDEYGATIPRKDFDKISTIQEVFDYLTNIK